MHTVSVGHDKLLLAVGVGGGEGGGVVVAGHEAPGPVSSSNL